MTDNDIREYIEECEEPIFMKDVLSELREDDPTISQKRVARLMREVGFENRPCKNVRNPKGKGSAWFRTGNSVTTFESDGDDDDDDVEEQEEQKGKTRSTADALHDVDAQNAVNAELSAKLFESLNRSRDLKSELMRRQQEALLELARRILACYGTERERKIYGGL